MASKLGIKRPGPIGNGCVLVRGFDFGTTDEQLETHMSSVGAIEKVKWITKGSAEVTYSSADEAEAAIAQLQKTTIAGNTRFIDVLASDGGERPKKRFDSGNTSWHKGGNGGQNDLLQAIQGLSGGGNSLSDALSALSSGLGGGSGWGKVGVSDVGKGGGWQSGSKFNVDKSGGELGEFSGKIKSFGFQKNYGFIECDELAEYGDVFLHGDMKKGYQQGQIVKFTAVLNKDGKPVAIDLKSGLRESHGPSAGTNAKAKWMTQGSGDNSLSNVLAMLSSSPGGGSGWGKGGGSDRGKGGGWQSSSKFKIDKSGGQLGEFSGKIKSFGFQKNYGFIECNELAEFGDVFLHGDMKKGYQQGQVVKFTAVLNKDGKPVAINLRSGLH